jgi:large subunit ribosomal protein L23
MDILIRPIVTEKLTAQSEKLNSYGFEVVKSANKVQIKKAVEAMYGVTVESVNTITTGGKSKSRNTKGGLIKGRTASFKKAIVTVAKDDKIDFYSNI